MTEEESKQIAEEEQAPLQEVIEPATLDTEMAADPEDGKPHEVDEASDAGDALLAEIESLKLKVQSLELKEQENLDKAVRATAELDNVRKRTSRDIENAHKYALEKFVQALLPVMDSMQLGINATESADNADSVEGLKEGMDLTLKMFGDCLEKSGVVAHDPLGERFDPQFHEAVSVIEQEGVESGKVIRVMQKGYDLNGRLLRPAMVVVAK